jgi:hypothetical protein
MRLPIQQVKPWPHREHRSSVYGMSVFRIQMISVVDRHRTDADPDPTFHFDAYPDPDQNKADPHVDPRFKHVGK